VLTINYFASVRESVGRSNDILELPEEVKNVEELISFLARNTETGLHKLADRSDLLVAVNQTVVGREHQLQADDEIAFFPPMTGG